MVMGVYDKLFDIFILKFGVSKRVYIDVSFYWNKYLFCFMVLYLYINVCIWIWYIVINLILELIEI